MSQKTATFSELSNFFPKQLEALEAVKKFKYVLYGGAMGGGKSHFLRWVAVYWLLYLHSKYHKFGIRVGLFCEDYGALNDRHISKVKLEFPKSLGTWNEVRKEFTLHPRFGSGVIAFRNLDDPSKYVSSEFAMILVDEIQRDPYSMFSILRTRLRWVGIPETRFVASCNWGGEPWVKRYWYDRNFPPEEKQGDEFVYVQSKATDNPHLGEEYYHTLESLSESERKVWIEGDPTGFEDEMDEEGWMRVLTDQELQNSFVEEGEHVGACIMGVDPAAGGDRSAIVVGTDTLKEVVLSQRLKNVLDMIFPIAKAFERYAVSEIIVDRTGVGEGLYQRLKELGFPVKGVAFGSKAVESEKFYNLKAELYWKEKEWILHGGKLKRHQGWNDWINIKWKRQMEKQIRIQGKEELRQRGFKSPDVVDAAVLLNYAYRNTAFDAVYRQTPFRDQTINLWRNA